MENKYSLGWFLMVGLVAIAIAIPYSVYKYTGASRSVTVKGLCEREVTANRAIWPVVFKEGGNSLAELSANVDKKNAMVVDWLLAAGFTKEEINVSAPKIEDQRANGWEHRSYDYVMTSVVTVCTDKVQEVLEMQHRQFEMINKGIALGSGNSWENPVVYSYTGLNEVKPEMIEQATLNARGAADKFAEDSGSRVGKILSATQGQFSITDRDANTPYIKVIRVVTTVNYQLK